MIQRSQGAGLTAESRQPLRVARELRGQGLDGDIATQLAVVCPIDFPHATGAERRHDSIRSELLAWDDICGRRGDRHFLHRRRFKETPGVFVFDQQQFYLPPQFSVSAASIVKECLSRLWPTLQGIVEETLYFPPAFRVQGDAPLLSDNVTPPMATDVGAAFFDF